MSTADLFDLTVVIIIVASAFRGYQKGLIHQLGAIISMIIGNIVSVRFTPVLADCLPIHYSFRSASAFVILLVVSTLITWGIINLLSYIVSNLKLNTWNKQMGALLGVAYGFLWAMTLTFILLIYSVPFPAATGVAVVDGNPLVQTTTPERSFIMESKSGRFLTKAALEIIDRLPHGGVDYKFYDYLREYLQRNADEIKVNNPDLPKDPFPFSSPDVGPDDDKPRLPVDSPLPD